MSHVDGHKLARSSSTSDGADAASSRKARRRELKVDAVLNAASKIFKDDGLEGLTLGRVANELDLVPAALYRYFPSKDALIAALQRRAIGELATQYKAYLANIDSRVQQVAPNTRAVTLVLASARFYLELPQNASEAWHLVAVLLGDPRALLPDEEALRAAPLLASFVTTAEEVIANLINVEALDSNRVNARAGTMQLWAALHGALCLDKLRRFEPILSKGSSITSTVELGMQLVETLLRGWGADPHTIRRARRVLDNRHE